MLDEFDNIKKEMVEWIFETFCVKFFVEPKNEFPSLHKEKMEKVNDEFRISDYWLRD